MLAPGEWLVERRYPLVELELDDIARLLAPLALGSPPVHAVLLRGGHVNTNYAVALADGGRLVLRMCQRGEAAFRKEVAMLRAMSGSVPVPELRGACSDPAVFELPYLVTAWVDAIPLNDARSVWPNEAEAIGAAVAASLLAIGRHSAPEHSTPPFARVIEQCLLEGGAASHMGDETAARVLAFAERHAAFLETVEQRRGVVHGDFQGDNILLQREGTWRVAAILDWEWAHHGSRLKDLGSLLRVDDALAAGFLRGLERAYAEASVPLPDGWMMAARIWDIAAQCEKLAFPRHRGEVTRRAIRIIERCLADYAA